MTCPENLRDWLVRLMDDPGSIHDLWEEEGDFGFVYTDDHNCEIAVAIGYLREDVEAR